jgi:uncharacterized protein
VNSVTEAGASPIRTPVIYEWSAEVFTIPLHHDEFLVYAPLRQSAFIANANLVNLLADVKDGITSGTEDKEAALQLLRHLQIIDAGPEFAPNESYTGEPEPTAVTLFLTTACNLRCTYCYASAGDSPAKHMPLSVARQGIDFVAENALRRGLQTFEVNYHGGGEPTVNWRVMTESFDYACTKAAQLHLQPPIVSAASNCVLREDQIDWMIANLNGGISVSFDGLPSVHDRCRLTIDGQGSSERVIHAVRQFDHAGLKYGVRVTVTAEQIVELPDSIEFICANFPGVQRIQVEPSYQLGRWREASSAETDEFISAYRRAQTRAAVYGREIFFSGARVGSLTNHFCGITQDSFALSPDGNVSSCFEVFSETRPWSSLFFYGTPNHSGKGYNFDMPTLEHLRRQTTQHRAFCQGCFAKWTCAGDCYHKAVSTTDDTEFRGTGRCHIIRELTKDQILTRIASTGGMIWHEKMG